MRFPLLVASVVVALSTSLQLTHSDEPATSATLALASVFTAADLPQIEPGKPAWQGSPSHFGCGIVRFDKWLYVSSAAGYILQFECDPATAKLTYKGATPLAPGHGTAYDLQFRCYIRHTDDNHDKLIMFLGDDPSGMMLAWYGIDKTTGTLTFEGNQAKVKCDHHNATLLWAPDQQHFCYGGRQLESVDWYRFGDDGIPVADGSFKMKNWGLDTQAPCVMTSPDWKNIYYLMFSQSDRKDFSKDIVPQIDTYTIDPKTHAITYVSSLQLPLPETVKGRAGGVIEPFSPDGKFTYVIFNVGDLKNSYYYTLTRDPVTGVLTLANPGPMTHADKLGALAKPDWDRQDRFAYTADGRSGYFVSSGTLGSFTRDPGTGALTLLPPIPDAGADKLALDPANGILFNVGEKISSFKVGGTAPNP